MPFSKIIKVARKYILVVAFIFLTCLMSGTSIYAMTLKDVVIIINNEKIETVTNKDSFEKVLEENNIYVNGYDYISTSLDTEIMRGKINVISIKKARAVTIELDVQAFTIMSTKDTVKELLDELHIILNNEYKIEGAKLDSLIESDMQIKIIRIKKDTIIETKEFPYSVVRVENKTMDEGTEKVVQKGVTQKNVNVYNVVWENNVLVSKKLVETKIIEEPVEAIIEYGIIKTHISQDGSVIRYTKILDMIGTAYTLSYEECGKTPDHPAYGITYSGEKVRHGIVAVDTDVIPLLTNLYIESTDGYRDYGFSLAADIGTGVDGNIIDMYAETYEQACDWGMRPVKVYILAEEE